MAEERKCRRAPVKTGCWLVDEEGATCLSIYDLSETGLCVTTKNPLPEGKVVCLQFFTPRSADPVTFDAEVVWNRLEPEGCMGLRFLSLDDEQKKVVSDCTEAMKRPGGEW